MSEPSKLKVTLIKSLNAAQGRHRISARALGLSKMWSTVEVPDNEEQRGLIRQLHYLVRVEKTDGV